MGENKDTKTKTEFKGIIFVLPLAVTMSFMLRNQECIVNFRAMFLWLWESHQHVCKKNKVSVCDRQKNQTKGF